MIRPKKHQCQGKAGHLCFPIAEMKISGDSSLANDSNGSSDVGCFRLAAFEVYDGFRRPSR